MIGMMFHHFHGESHPAVQGSISGVELREIVKHLCSNYNLLNADMFHKKHEKGRLDKRDICLTFDDGLACQYDIALPILNEFGIKAFFFVYTSVLEGRAEMLELHRYFRTVCFDTVDDFYIKFFDVFDAFFPSESKVAQNNFIKGDFFGEFSFYTVHDKYYRYIRNYILSPTDFNSIYEQMMAEANFNAAAVADKLWMKRHQLEGLVSDGHLLGLHSHSHPTDIRLLSKEEQYAQYATNQSVLQEISKSPIKAMSHPCGFYNDESLDTLRDLGVNLGFRSNSAPNVPGSGLEVPRIDHMTVYRQVFG